MELAKAYDVIVVGGGNAALCAALSASEEGAKVVVLERAPQSERGGNSCYTEMIRCVYNGVEDIQALCPDISSEDIAMSDFGRYTEDQFFDDMARTTENRTDPDLCEIMIRQSNPTMHWLRKNGVRFLPYFGKQAYKIDGIFRFFGGVILELWGGGQGLMAALYKRGEQAGVDIRYGAWVRELIHDSRGVRGVVADMGGQPVEIFGKAVVLACGGFESNPEWRARYLGKGWDLAKVRGTKFNTGDGLAMATRIGASPYGHWSGCHAVSWERYATEFGDIPTTPSYWRHSYPFSIMVNARGERFLDEGADLRNYTYAKYGQMVLEQPGHFAYQIYDAKVLPLLREEYKKKHVTRVRAQSLEELAQKLDDVDGAKLLQTIREYNAAIHTDRPFRPDIKDGRCTTGLSVPKSNWANTIDNPPFEAYAVTCAITFTYGGLRITNKAEVLNTNLERIDGLYAAGEIVGGMFYFNYPGGTGLMSGAVFGRIAGQSAANFARGIQVVDTHHAGMHTIPG
ncbi:FAD-dependent tricarballylate dehydrogenase TcuA [Candidimonas nitroreducens]|uniref:Tricarballylate dehydrogenase n=1 Tax=Candidimonas nitroreducens TaxID=683354 RepID=A0A225M700_9BURK|nr:FAD-dependent tricarballylate dehydrogenase TcuA [Candidimonas nitroreducens]OWT56906.1 tricarballylate dehydrogenase [Candidimonas nitroreducens]